MSVKTTKPYIYRKHLREPVKFLLGSLLFFIGVMLYTLLILLPGSFTSLNSDAFKLISLSIIPALIGASTSYIVLYFVLFRKLKKVCVTLEDDKLVYHNGNKLINIPYQDITALKFPSIKYTGGWLKIVYGKKSIRLTVVLENIGEFVKELKDKLDTIDKSTIYKEKSLYNFYKTATYSDQSWERVYEYFTTYLKAILINMIVNFGISFLTPIKSEKLLIGALGMFVLMLAFTLSEIILASIIAKKSKVEGFNIRPRDKKLELKVNKIVFCVAISIEFIVLTFVLI